MHSKLLTVKNHTMSSRIISFFIFLSFCLPSVAQKDVKAAEQLLSRVAPSYCKKISFELSPASENDYFELVPNGKNIIIRGNCANSMAVGLNHFLKYYCLTTVSWYAADRVELPTTFPTLTEKVSIDARTKNRFFLNYCTFGYTMPWWKWNDWERLIDWMALNGVNLPLAITGQEVIWHKVWTKLGLTDKEVRNYFTGPAHLAWHRMANMDYFQGNLPDSWLNSQEALQKQIVARERELNMKPVLPAFAGHVPKELKRLYPEANIHLLSNWGGFTDEYRGSFLYPLDPLFKKIQKEFLTEQTRLFGTDHIYGADPFNEMDSPSWEPEYLAKVTKTIYESMTEVDPKATWFQMTWMFYFDQGKWTNPRINAFLRGVPQDKMLLLDYYCENTEVWKKTESFFGQPYIWCYLGNFGGNTMMVGKVKEVGKRIENTYQNGGKNLWGIGSTLESFDVNPFMYEYVFEKAWNNKIDDEQWMQKLADRYTGKEDKNFREAWKQLLEKIYIGNAQLGQATLTNARPSLEGNGNWTTNPKTAYNNKDLCDIWGLMLKAENRNREFYRFSVVNVGRQVMGNYFSVLRDNFTKAYKAKDMAEMKKTSAQMMELLDDMDALVATFPSFFSLNDWIADAREIGVNTQEKAYYEENARTILTTWGVKGQSLNEYASRSWSGLISTYYKPRWQMFVTDVMAASAANKTFDAKVFNEKVQQFEIDWTKSTIMPKAPKCANSVKLAEKLYSKYQSQIK